MKSSRRFLIPEVVQTSTMDCGPACLTALLEGHGIGVSYDALRQACQTDVDGTSIDTMELLANDFGLVADQIMVPIDHVLLSEAEALPAIVVVSASNSMAHFVVAWQTAGGLIQLMDPATGRHWIGARSFLQRVYIHAQAVRAVEWREWAASEQFIRALKKRGRTAGLAIPELTAIIDAALSSSDWRPIATLDAGLRMLSQIGQSARSLDSKTAGKLLRRVYERGLINPFETIPPVYWSVLPGRDMTEDGQLVFRGAVLVRVTGRRASTEKVAEAPQDQRILSRSIQEQLHRPTVSTVKLLRHMLTADGLLAPTILTIATLVAAGGVLFEALLFRSFLDARTMLATPHQRIGAALVLLGLLSLLTLLDLSLANVLLGLGRKLETRMRLTLLSALPRLNHKYFSSRLISDMAERSHAIQEIRALPLLGQQFIYGVLQLLMTTMGVIWLDSATAAVAISLAIVSAGLPLLTEPVVAERDLRFRTHTGALCRFYFDALRGIIPLRTHGATGAMQSEHESLLVDWAHSGIRLQVVSVVVTGVSLFAGFALVAWLLMGHFSRTQDTAVQLLLVYWALNIPALGFQVGQLALQYPRQKNLASRLLEPIAELESETEAQLAMAESTAPKDIGARSCEGSSIVLENVTVYALGQTILQDVSLNIGSGAHVCIVGSSGAGKSTLIGLLLGLHNAASGRVQVDERELTGEYLDRVRMATAWLDPNVHLWNRSLLDNLRYGGLDTEGDFNIASTLESAALNPLIEKLAEKLGTKLGEGGALVSGGEGQRVRFGRALMRRDCRLALLDEPFTALDREQRRTFLRNARSHWKHCTLLCVTHDVSQALEFDRVIVLDHGTVVEDGNPSALAQMQNSIFHRMLKAEEATLRSVWSDQAWRKIRIVNGRAVDTYEKEIHHGRFGESLLADVTDR